MLSIWLACDSASVRRYYMWYRCMYILLKKEKLRTGDPCAYLTYFLRSFQAVVQKRGSERHFSKKRQELGLGNSKLARFTQYSLRDMELNLERTLKLYKWVFKTLLVWPVLMNKPHVKGKKYQTLANWTSQFSNCAMNILCSQSNGKRYTWCFLSRVLRNLGLIVKLKEI